MFLYYNAFVEVTSMILITIYGLDRFVTGRLSRELSKNLSKAYEVSEDELLFVGTENMVFHQGFEQTSWNAIIKVEAPENLHDLEDTAKLVLLDGLKPYCINATLLFSYFHKEHCHLETNDEYPRFISGENVVNINEEEYEDYDDDEDDEHHHHHDDEEELFTGDIFEGLNL